MNRRAPKPEAAAVPMSAGWATKRSQMLAWDPARTGLCGRGVADNSPGFNANRRTLLRISKEIDALRVNAEIQALAEQGDYDFLRCAFKSAYCEVFAKANMDAQTVLGSSKLWRAIDALSCAFHKVASESARTELKFIAWEICSLTGWPRSDWACFEK